MTLNRAARRGLARRLEAARTAGSVAPASVRLVGGPMDGWVVKPDAAALRPSWHSEYAEAMRLLGKRPLGPGRYMDPVVDAATGTRTSRWVEHYPVTTA